MNDHIQKRKQTKQNKKQKQKNRHKTNKQTKITNTNVCCNAEILICCKWVVMKISETIGPPTPSHMKLGVVTLPLQVHVFLRGLCLINVHALNVSVLHPNKVAVNCGAITKKIEDELNERSSIH